MGYLAVYTILSAALGSASLSVSAPAEWTFERARRLWKPMVRPVQHVGVPGYSFQTAVMWDGALVFGPLGFRNLKVMQQETEPLGDNLLHISFAFGDHPAFADRKGEGSARIRRSLEGGALPMPTVETTDGCLVWTESVFAHLLDRECGVLSEPRPTDTLVTHARFTVRNTGQTPVPAHLWIYLGRVNDVALGYKCSQHDELGETLLHEPVRPDGTAVPGEGCSGPVIGRLGERVRYVLQAPSAGVIRFHSRVDAIGGVRSAGERVLEWSTLLAPGRRATLRLIVPYGTVSASDAERLLELDGAARRREVVRYWRKVVDGAGRMVTPDPFINDYLSAVAAQMAQQTAYRRSTDLWMYKTSPNHYEGYWPCNAAKALPVFDLRGLSGINRHVLDGFLKSQTDDVGGLDRRGMGSGDRLPGAGFAKVPGFLGNFGEWTANPLLISHGLGMWALASHYRITRDDDWLRGTAAPGAPPRRSPLDAMLQAFDWISTQRRRTMHVGTGGRASNWGLLPAASAHDWLAGSTIFNDAFCIYGMAEVVRLLRETDHPRVAECAAELADYRKCLHDRYAEARDRARPVPLSDGSRLPFVPRMVDEPDWAGLDWTYTGYGPLRAGAWGALDPHDELVTQALTFLEQGMPRGEGAYFSAHLAHADTADANWADISDPEALRHYLWRHYVEYETMWPIGCHLFLARDDPTRFFEWLTNNLAVAIHRDWRVGVESLDGVPSCAPGDAERWLAIRSMFIREAGGYDGSAQSLFLMQAIPREWLGPGAKLAVSRMGTWFGGTVDLSLAVTNDGRQVRVTARLRGLRAMPASIRLRLKAPAGAAILAVTANGKRARVQQGDLVLLAPKLNGVYRIVAQIGDRPVP